VQPAPAGRAGTPILYGVMKHENPLYDVMEHETQDTLYKPLKSIKNITENSTEKFTKNHNKCNPLQQGVRALLYDVMKHENPLYDVMEHEAQDTLYKPLKSIKNITVNSTEIFT
jgi:hypothetical protein